MNEKVIKVGQIWRYENKYLKATFGENTSYWRIDKLYATTCKITQVLHNGVKAPTGNYDEHYTLQFFETELDNKLLWSLHSPINKEKNIYDELVRILS